jgi:hypothetical protein
MTYAQFSDKINELLAGDAGIQEVIKDACMKLTKAGCLDLDSAEDNYLLPKQVLCAVLKELAKQYEPPSNNKKWLKQVSNMQIFVKF